MGAIWSESRKLDAWKDVEVATLEAFEAIGTVPKGVATALAKADTPTPEEVDEREAVTNHDLAAFVDLLGDKAGRALRGKD